jgi:multicomponent Na+:H+ antiporter subunit F
MSVAETILSLTTWLALALLVAAFLLTVWRVVQGPTLPDRVVALDMLVGIVIGFIALIAIRTGFTLYIDIAIALGLVGFLATVAFARFILVSKAGQKAIRDVATAPLERRSAVTDDAHAEAGGAVARGAETKPKAKSSRNSARAKAKTGAKTVSSTVAKRSVSPAPVNETAGSASPAAAPVERPAAKSRGKSNDAVTEKPTSKPPSKSAEKPASKSSSKSNSKTAKKPAGKATTKPARGE